MQSSDFVPEDVNITIGSKEPRWYKLYKPTLCLTKEDFVKNFGHNFGKHPRSYPCFAKIEDNDGGLAGYYKWIEVAYLPQFYMFLDPLELISIGLTLKFHNLDEDWK